MRLFGRKANQQSATEVPPELQPYYGQPKRQVWWDRARLFILPVLAVVLLAGAAIGAVIWAHSHTISNPFHKSTSSSQTARNSPGSDGSKKSQPPSSSATSGTSSQSPSSSDNSSQQSSSSAQTTASSSANNIPNTGPSDTALLISGMMGVLGMAAYHARQLRRAKQNS